jgi:hypothetical protein
METGGGVAMLTKAKGLAKRFRTWFALLIVVTVAVWSIPEPREYLPENESIVDSAESPIQQKVIEQFEIVLYIPDESGARLVPTETTIVSGVSAEDKIEASLITLFANEDFYFMTRQTVIREIFIYENQAIVSMDASFRKAFNGGVLEERLALMAMVNTMIKNNEGIDAVQILIDDRHEDYFINAITIDRPVYADISLVTNEPSPAIAVASQPKS